MAKTIRERWIEKGESKNLLFLPSEHDNAILGLCHIAGKTVVVYDANRVATNFMCELIISEYEAMEMVSDLERKTNNPIFMYR